MLEPFSVLSHVGQVKLNGLGVVLNVRILYQLIHISLSILPVNVQRLRRKLHYLLCNLVLRCLDHLLYLAHRRLQILYDRNRVQVVILRYLPVLTHNVVPFLQYVYVLLHLPMLWPSLKILQRSHTLFNQETQLIENIVKTRLQTQPQLANLTNVPPHRLSNHFFFYYQFLTTLQFWFLSYVVQRVENLSSPFDFHAYVKNLHGNLPDVVLCQLIWTKYQLNVEHLFFLIVLTLFWGFMWVMHFNFAFYLKGVELMAEGLNLSLENTC